jgi:HPt (histidine-containing phosphotransfer) domain-containing protein
MKTDLSYLKEMSGGNDELILEMIGIFRDQVKEFLQGMEEHLEKKEYELLGKLAHKAKSSISIMGLNELAIELKSLELKAKTGVDTEKYPAIIDRFRIETTEAVIELDEIVKNYKQYF